MKTHVKKEKKKYPYHRKKYPIFAQIKAREQRIKKKLPNYAIVDENNKIIEKFRLKWTVDRALKKLEKEYYEKLRIVVLDINGEVPSKG